MHWRRKWQPTPVFLPGASQGQGSLVRCRLWSCRVGHNLSDLAGAAAAEGAGDPGLIPESERFPGKGNDNPLQYSCLENSMDRGSWWAAIHWVTKSQR